MGNDSEKSHCSLNEKRSVSGMKKLRRSSLIMLLFSTILLADSIGVYECGNCDPSDPSDLNTMAFIANVVNQGIGNWKAGDHVLIINPNTGKKGVWGRASAFGPRQYMGHPGVWGYIPSPGGGSGANGWYWTDPCGLLEVCTGFDPY